MKIQKKTLHFFLAAQFFSRAGARAMASRWQLAMALLAGAAAGSPNCTMSTLNCGKVCTLREGKELTTRLGMCRLCKCRLCDICLSAWASGQTAWHPLSQPVAPVEYKQHPAFHTTPIVRRTAKQTLGKSTLRAKAGSIAGPRPDSMKPADKSRDGKVGAAGRGRGRMEKRKGRKNGLSNFSDSASVRVNSTVGIKSRKHAAMKDAMARDWKAQSAHSRAIGLKVGLALLGLFVLVGLMTLWSILHLSLIHI